MSNATGQGQRSSGAPWRICHELVSPPGGYGRNETVKRYEMERGEYTGSVK